MHVHTLGTFVGMCDRVVIIPASRFPCFPYMGVGGATASTPDAVSTALVRDEGRGQKPVYYVSKALKGAEKNYLKIELLWDAKF